MTEENAVELPMYRSHKLVRAAKIVDVIERPTDPGSDLVVEFPGGTMRATVPVTREWMMRHGPEVGGYLVQYEDGYQSYSPAKAFEEGYVKHKPYRTQHHIELPGDACLQLHTMPDAAQVTMPELCRLFRNLADDFDVGSEHGLAVEFPRVTVRATPACDPMELKLSLASVLRSNVTKVDGKWSVDVRSFDTKETDIIDVAEGRDHGPVHRAG